MLLHRLTRRRPTDEDLAAEFERGWKAGHAAALGEDLRSPAPDPATWECQIGETARDGLPHGADFPMRRAVEAAYIEITGHKPEFIFSGWGCRLTPIQRSIVDGDRRQRAEREAEVAELRPQIEELRRQRAADLARTDSAVGDGVPSGDSARLSRTDFDPEEPGGPASRSENNHPGYP